MTPNLLLQRNVVVKSSPDEYLVIMPQPDGYRLQVGHISKQTGANHRVVWQWSGPGGTGKDATQEDAMASLKAKWGASEQQLDEMRRQQESTEWKYALWDAGYRSQMVNDEIRCRCGAMFAPESHEAVRAHIDHIRARC